MRAFKIPLQQKSPAQYLKYLRRCLCRYRNAKFPDRERIASTEYLIELMTQINKPL